MAEIELNPDFRHVLHELSAAGAEFVLIGGWALAAHGYGRGTDDLDVRAEGDRRDAAQDALRSALEQALGPGVQRKRKTTAER